MANYTCPDGCPLYGAVEAAERPWRENAASAKHSKKWCIAGRVSPPGRGRVAGSGGRRWGCSAQIPLPTTRRDTCSGLIRDNQEDADLFAWLQLMHQHCEQVLFALHGLYLQARCIITHGYEWYCAEHDSFLISFLERHNNFYRCKFFRKTTNMYKLYICVCWFEVQLSVLWSG